MTKDIDSLIKQKQEELNSLKLQMEQIRQRFVRDSTMFIRKWYEETTENYVINNAEKTINLGKEKLRQMKTKVLELIENAEEIANKALSNPELWWHLVENDELYYDYYGNAPPKILDKAIRYALGKLGTILEKFGYDVKTKSTGISFEGNVWCERDPSGRYHLPDSKPYYPYHVNWSEEMQNSIKKYNEICVKAKKVRKEINSLYNEKKKQQAKNLWDSI